MSPSLDPGERAAIALAERVRADLLLIDEKAGRAEARRRGLRFTGMLGILLRAADQRLIDARDVLTRLRATNFYVEQDLLERMFERWLKG